MNRRNWAEKHVSAMHYDMKMMSELTRAGKKITWFFPTSKTENLDLALNSQSTFVNHISMCLGFPLQYPEFPVKCLKYLDSEYTIEQNSYHSGNLHKILNRNLVPDCLLSIVGPFCPLFAIFFPIVNKKVSKKFQQSILYFFGIKFFIIK